MSTLSSTAEHQTQPTPLGFVRNATIFMNTTAATANMDVYFHTYCMTNRTYVAIIDTNATICKPCKCTPLHYSFCPLLMSILSSTAELQAFRHQIDRRLLLITAGGLVSVSVVACIAAHYYISCRRTRISAAGRRVKTRK